jgi:hypothetical protein
MRDSIDPADIERKELAENISVYFHDFGGALVSLGGTLGAYIDSVKGKSKAPAEATMAFELCDRTFKKLKRIHSRSSVPRQSLPEMSRAELSEWIGRCRKGLESVFRDFEVFAAYWKKNENKIYTFIEKRHNAALKARGEEGDQFPVRESMDQTIELARNQFMPENFGLPVAGFIEPIDLTGFFKAWSRRKFTDQDGNEVKIIFRGRKVPQVLGSIDLLERAAFNLVTDAINHTPGRPVYVTVTSHNGLVYLNVTNAGRKLSEREMAMIGRVRYSRRMDDPRRGYGKILVRKAAEAMGMRFTKGNSRIGPLLGLEAKPLRPRPRLQPRHAH